MSTGALGSLCHGSARPLPCFKQVSTAQCMCGRAGAQVLSDADAGTSVDATWFQGGLAAVAQEAPAAAAGARA